RLTTARRLLAQRLSRQGVTLSSGTMAALLSEVVPPVGVSSPLAAATVKAAMGLIPAEIAGLTEGVLNAMHLSRMKNLVTLLLLTAARLGTAAAVAIGHDPTAQAKAPALEPPPANDGAAKAAPAKRFENAPGWVWYQEEPRLRNGLGTGFSIGDVDG